MNIDFEFLGDTLSKLFAAVPTTLGLFFASLIVGGLLSLVIVAMRVSPNWALNRFARGYILVFRGSPLLIQMFLVYYGLGQFPAVSRKLPLADPARAVCVRDRLARVVHRRIYR